MAIWYEVEHSKAGIYNFMECNYCFHDFKTERIHYSPEDNSAELFLKYDELKGSIILRFLDIHSMRVTIEADYGYQEELQGSVLLLLDDGQFLWIGSDTWGEQSNTHIDELKKEYSWVQAEKIIWAVTDNHGLPTEMPTDKIDQVWSIYGKTEYHHFDLTPFRENM